MKWRIEILDDTMPIMAALKVHPESAYVVDRVIECDHDTKPELDDGVSGTVEELT